MKRENYILKGMIVWALMIVCCLPSRPSASYALDEDTYSDSSFSVLTEDEVFIDSGEDEILEDYQAENDPSADDFHETKEFTPSTESLLEKLETAADSELSEDTMTDETDPVVTSESINEVANSEKKIFSVYPLPAEGEMGQDSRRNYLFYVHDEVFFKQILKENDVLGDPGIPVLGENEEFAGWYRTDDPDRTPVTIDDLRDELENAVFSEGETVSLSALIRRTHTVTFLNEYQHVIETVKVYDGEGYTVTETLQTEGPDTVFRGWLLDGKPVSVGGTIENISSDIVLTPEIHALFRLTFNANCEDESGLDLPAVMAEEGTDLSYWLPGREIMVRQGYEFIGWYRGHEEDGNVTLEGEIVADGTVTGEDSFYAGWIPAADTAFTVKIWKQSVDDDYRIGLNSDSPYYDENHDLSGTSKSYVLDRVVRLQGTTGTDISLAEGYTDLINADPGFYFAKLTVQQTDGTESLLINANGGTLVNLYFDRQIMELTCAGVEVREFTESVDQTGNLYGTDGTSWFPIYGIETNGYVQVPDTVAEEGKEYFGTDDNGISFFRIWFRENAVSFTESTADSAVYRLSDDGNTYVRVYRVNGVWRLKNSSDGEEYYGVRYKAGSSRELWLRTSSANNSVAYYGNRYLCGSVLEWYRENNAGGEPYRGTRYVCTTDTRDIVFTGLYGQTFQKYRYTWPQDYITAGTSLTDGFTDVNLFPDTTDDDTVRSGTVNPVQVSSNEEKITVHIYTRDANGSFDEYAVFSCCLEGSSAFTADNSLSGLSFSEYAWSDSPLPPEEGHWYSGELLPEGTVRCDGHEGQAHLHLHYEPQGCRLVFRDGFRQGSEGEFKTLGLSYGDMLSEYQPLASDVPVREGYVFAGWFLDPYGMEPFLWEGKICSAEMTVYAGWERCSYRIVVDLCDEADSPAVYNPGRSFLIPDSGSLPNSVPSRPGYRFLGFYTDQALTHEFLLSTRIDATVSALKLDYPSSNEYREGLDEGGIIIHEGEREEDHVVGKLQLFAGWEKLTKTSLFLKYDANGGSDAPVDETDYYGREYVIAHGICVPPAEMGFLCWTYVEAESGRDVDVYPGHVFPLKSADASVEEYENRIVYTLTLKAKYVRKQTIDSVTVTFASNGGNQDYSFTVLPNETFEVPDAETAGVTREGYRLVGWNTEDDGSGDRFLPGDTVAANSRGSNILYAEWEKISCTVAFSLNTGETENSLMDQKVPYGEMLKKPDDPARQGYRFTGWTRDGERYNFASPVRENFTLVANWVKENSVTYRVFSASGVELSGAPTEERGYLPGEIVRLKPEPQAIAGYHNFSGWSIDGVRIENEQFVMPEDHVTVSGTYSPVRYSILYDLGGGSLTEENPASYTVEDADRALNSPVRAGYTFLGWTGANGTAAQKDVVIVKGTTGDLRFSAVWVPMSNIRYTVTVHYPADWDLSDSIPNATVDTVSKTAVYECYGTADTKVTAQAFQNPNDRRLTCDAGHEGSILQGRIDPDGSLELHVFLKKVEYQYDLEYCLKGTEIILSRYSGVTLPDELGSAEIEASLEDITLETPYSNYRSRMMIDGNPVRTVTRDHAVLSIPVVLRVDIDRMDTREIYNNGEEQQGYLINEVLGASFTSTSVDGHLEVSGLLPGDSLLISMTPAKGQKPGLYHASFDGVVFTKGENSVSYYRFSGFDPETMGRLSILETLTVVWKNGEVVLFTDPYVPPNTVPEYRGETPRKESDFRYDYEFNGWDPEVGVVKKDSIYSATFSKTYRSYTVTWLNEDGSLLRENLFQYGAFPKYGGTTPQKAEDREYSYTFKGWSPSLSEVSGDTEYRAVFERTPQKYQIKYIVDGEQSGGLLAVSFGEEVSLRPDLPAKDGYRFSGWSSREVSPVDGKFIMPAENVTITGSFVQLPKADYDVRQLTDAQKPQARRGLLYTGKEQTLFSDIREMPADFSVIRFSLDAGKTWSSQIPKGKDAGNYTIFMEYSGSKRYNDFQLQPVEVAIGKGSIPVFQCEIYEESTYSGMKLGFLRVIPSLPDEVSVEYRVLTSEGEPVSDWSAALPGAVNPGQYKVYYKITGGENYNSEGPTWIDNGTGSFAVIKKAEQTPPSVKPRLSCPEPGTIRISGAVEGQEYLAKPKGEIPSDEDWADSLSVSESTGTLSIHLLSPGGEFIVFSRKAETDFYNASGYLASDPITVLKEHQGKPSAPVSAEVGITTVTVKPAAADQEYRLDGISDWTPVPAGETELTFTGLKPDTDYWISARMAETETKAASEPGEPIKVRTSDVALVTEIRRQGGTAPVIQTDGLTKEFAKGMLDEEDKKHLSKGNTITVFLRIEDTSSTISAAEKGLVTEKAKTLDSNAVVWSYLDISLMKQLEDQTPVPITELMNQSLGIKLTIPADIRNTDAAVKRVFHVVTVHNGTAEILTPAVNGDCLEFTADCFSTYAFLYADQKTEISVNDVTQPALSSSTLPTASGNTVSTAITAAAGETSAGTGSDILNGNRAGTEDQGPENQVKTEPSQSAPEPGPGYTHNDADHWQSTDDTEGTDAATRSGLLGFGYRLLFPLVVLALLYALRSRLGLFGKRKKREEENLPAKDNSEESLGPESTVND